MKHMRACSLPYLGIRLEIFKAYATVGEHVVMLRLTECDLLQRFVKVFQAPPFLSLHLPVQRTISDLANDCLNLVLFIGLKRPLLPTASPAAKGLTDPSEAALSDKYEKDDKDHREYEGADYQDYH